MEPKDLLAALCRPHGLDAYQHRDLLPLAERAIQSRAQARQRLLALLQEALALRARRERRPSDLHLSLEEGLLLEVARALHGWSPEDGPLDLGGNGRAQGPGRP